MLNVKKSFYYITLFCFNFFIGMEKVVNIEGVLTEQRYDFPGDCGRIVLPQTSFFELRSYNEATKNYTANLTSEGQVTGNVMPSAYLKIIDQNDVVFYHNNLPLNIAQSLKTNLDLKNKVFLDCNPNEEFFVIVNGSEGFFKHYKSQKSFNITISDFKEGLQYNVSTNGCNFSRSIFSVCFNKQNQLAVSVFGSHNTIDRLSLEHNELCIKHMFLSPSLLVCLFPNTMQFYELSCDCNKVNNEVKNSFFPVDFDLGESKGQFVSFAVHKKMPQSFVLLTLRKFLVHSANKCYDLFFVQEQLKERKMTRIWSSNSDQGFDNVSFGGSRAQPIVLLWNSDQTRSITQLVFQKGWKDLIGAHYSSSDEDEYYSFDEDDVEVVQINSLNPPIIVELPKLVKLEDEQKVQDLVVEEIPLLKPVGLPEPEPKIEREVKRQSPVVPIINKPPHNEAPESNDSPKKRSFRWVGLLPPAFLLGSIAVAIVCKFQFPELFDAGLSFCKERFLKLWQFRFFKTIF